MRTLAALLALALATAGAAAADSLGIYCDGDLIGKGASKAEVLLRCGEPLMRETVGDIRQQTPDGRTRLRVEEWTYDVGEGSFLRILTFHGGTLVEIDTGERR